MLGAITATALVACSGAGGSVGPVVPTDAVPTDAVSTTWTSTAPPTSLEPTPPTSSTSPSVDDPEVAFDTVVLLGDSLLWEATPYLLPLLDGREVVQLPFSGAAVCDGLQVLPPVDRSTLVVVSYTGNSMTPCMAGADGELLVGAEVVEKYRVDTAELVRRIIGSGATALLVGQPVRGEAFGRNEIVVGINADSASLAALSGVRFVDAGAAVENPDGSFAATLPCLTAEPQCGADGRNAVRSSDELHFCPAKLDFAPCAVYSSGAYRFALAIASAIDAN